MQTQTCRDCATQTYCETTCRYCARRKQIVRHKQTCRDRATQTDCDTTCKDCATQADCEAQDTQRLCDADDAQNRGAGSSPCSEPRRLPARNSAATATPCEERCRAATATPARNAGDGDALSCEPPRATTQKVKKGKRSQQLVIFNFQLVRVTGTYNQLYYLMQIH